MVAALLIGAAAASALLAAASLRLSSLTASLLAAYLAFAGNLGLTTAALSPIHLVTRAGLGAAEAILLTASLAAWSLIGRPWPSFAPARIAARAIAREPVAAGFVVLAAALLAYELALGLTVPPNNWDSLTYHLVRAAAWAQHGGLYWIPNVPSDRLNTFQPLAEQEILFLFVATGKGALYALPQYLAELALLVSVYGGARRLGFGPPPAAAAAGLFASLGLVTLESTTAQNDLVAASFPAIAAYFLLGRSPNDQALAGAAAGLGLGVKLTTILVWPVLVALVVLRGRRAAVPAAAGAVAGFVLVGMWGYVLNLAHGTGLFGGTADGLRASPSWPGTLQSAVHLLYRTLDLSVLSNRVIVGLAVAAGFAAIAVGVRRGPAAAVWVALPLCAPVLVIGAGDVIAYLTRLGHIPVHSDVPPTGGINRTADEDYSAFGPLGALALAGASVLAVSAWRRRRAVAGELALVAAYPLFVVLLAFESSFNVFQTRFLLVPVALAAPLFARLFPFRAAGLATLAVAAIVGITTLEQDRMKPLRSALGAPWHLDQVKAVELQWQPQAGSALAALQARVPRRACLGAVVGPDEPAYLLFGPRLERPVRYLPGSGTLSAALAQTLSYVVVSPAVASTAVADFRQAGWKVADLGGYWQLLSARTTRARTGVCD